ncbi:MAG: galactose-1-phosphate uridylyltransferase, partial [Gemmatimonadaceae bacterium]
MSSPHAAASAPDLERLAEEPHRRLDLLTGEWVLVSPHRTKRPWQGKVERLMDVVRPQYEPTCYLCPGNQRAGGHQNPGYTGTFVFDNDFAALLPNGSSAPSTPLAGTPTITVARMLQARLEPGVCRVVCFSPRHDLTLAEMDQPAVRRVVDVWAEEYARLGS